MAEHHSGQHCSTVPETLAGKGACAEYVMTQSEIQVQRGHRRGRVISGKPGLRDALCFLGIGIETECRKSTSENQEMVMSSANGYSHYGPFPVG